MVNKSESVSIGVFRTDTLSGGPDGDFNALGRGGLHFEAAQSVSADAYAQRNPATPRFAVNDREISPEQREEFAMRSIITSVRHEITALLDAQYRYEEILLPLLQSVCADVIEALRKRHKDNNDKDKNPIDVEVSIISYYAQKMAELAIPVEYRRSDTSGAA